ncbi:MAG: flagellar hook assembly protein FlgD [Gammaproteobacteria bacterium]|jgi:flagellar basal-body rod modification protein FlgD|nr:flagellar hook assembly protein FlgD [Gammaproteobacteria bacterium]
MNPTSSLSELFPSTANGAANAAPSSPAELGQEDFLELMVAQLENQDPTQPMDNFEFLSQIAQFGTVDGIQGLQQGFAELSGILYANQTLQAAGLVGSNVVTESNLGTLSAEAPLAATVDLPSASSEVTLYVQDTAGRLVHSRTLGAVNAGELGVQWDGMDNDGNPMPPGEYRVSAEAVIGGQVQAVSVYAHAQVESVTIDQANASVTLNLVGGDQVALSSVKRFI